MVVHKNKTSAQVVTALAVSNGVAVLLLLIRMAASGSSRYWYLLWNLVLAWIPVLLATLLVRYVSKHRWKSWQSLGLSILWLLFLPNSFYMVSDLVHLHPTGEISLLFDIVLMQAFIINALIAGCMSIYIVHKALLKRTSTQNAHYLIASSLLLSSFAVYLGRYLRWNSWDAVFSPAGLLFDVSERIINPVAQPQAVVTTVTFFMLSASLYYVFWVFMESRSRAK